MPFAALLLACVVAPAAAVPTTGAPATPGKETGFEARLNAIFAALLERDHDDAARQLDQLERALPDNDGAKGIMLGLRALVAAGRGHDAEATRLLAQSEKLLPDQADLAPMNYIGLLVSGRLKLAGAYLDRMIARYPDKVRELEWSQVRPLLWEETGEPPRTVEDRKIALAQLGFGGNSGDYLAEEAAGLLLTRGDQAGAAALIRYIDEPTLVEDMLIQRRYAPLWPALEAQAGPQLGRTMDSMVLRAEQKAAADPNDHEAQADLVNAYRKARRYDRLPSVRASLPATSADLAKADEQTGWAINNLAYAFFEQGKWQEADALFASLNGAIKDSWRINMLINRVELLTTRGEFARALPLIGEAETGDKSPYAAQLLRRLRYCSLVRLGRAAEAAALRPAMMQHAKDARGATVDGLLCAGEIDAAEQLALTLTDKPDDQAVYVRSLQPTPLTSDDPSTWQRWSVLRQRPAIAALYQRLGRDLPASLVAAEPPR
jgi:hypothetical protein